MAKFTGTVRMNDLEGGFLELVTDDGEVGARAGRPAEVYRISGAKPAVGARVRITGKLEVGGFGIHMSGPAIQVEKFEVL